MRKLSEMDFEMKYRSRLCYFEEPSLPYYLPIAGGRIIGFIPFPRVLVLCEMQLVFSRIWTHFYVFKLDHVKTIKNICCVKDYGIIDHSWETRWLKIIHLVCKSLYDHTKSGQSEIFYSKAIF